ncbi:PREDICTED: uncharacterized protein LOC106319820 [Brassica oleracea var. oleracea]|uniref:uncharacterized protein LOC106319820 n=1 Tax=Brassica oleracea var. oleracea TaxID=109376 RepID=UPI0006A6D0DB|nr:PREDICTED: uncharacterized protein LOC106319820 [Brassica oleracea var. oleracea]
MADNPALASQGAIIEAARTSPYYLHPSDNPGALITSVLLKGDNYTECATELSNSIQAKQKLGFINGTIAKPTTEPDLTRWLATNSMLVGWIRTSIDPKIRSTVTFVPEAHKLWENLQRRFSVKNGVRIHQVRDSINTCQQTGQSVIEYYGRLTKLWEELDNLTTTRACTCEAATDIEKERDEIRVHKFLFGLDESRFRNIRSQIIDEDPLPDINKVYSRVIREEQHNNSRPAETKTEAIGFSAQTDLTSSSSSKPDPLQAAVVRSRDPNRVCTHCSRTGHEKSECFLLHGFPEWWNEQPRNNSGGGSYTQRGRGGRFSNNRVRGGRSNTTRATTNNATSSTINNDQIAQIIQLLQSSRSNISSERLAGKTKFSDIIIDTGASHHMTGNLSLLSDVSDVVPSSVKFPDGRFSQALKKGTLVLSRDYRPFYEDPDWNG